METSEQTGKDVLLENLREICLFNSLPHFKLTWWDYMKYVHKECYRAITEECSENAFKSLSVDFTTIQKCVNNSFTREDWSAKSTKNDLLEKEYLAWKARGSGLYPAIVINNKTYHGVIEIRSVYNAICAGYSQLPFICTQTAKMYTPDILKRYSSSYNDGLGYLFTFLLALLMIAINVAVVYCFRRGSKREM